MQQAEEQLSLFPEIVPIRTKEEISTLQKVALEDNHIIIYPTHTVFRGSEVIGGFSLFTMPVLMFWMHSGKAKLRDSLQVNCAINTLAREKGLTSFALLYNESSPYAPHLEKTFKYEKLCQTNLAMKSLI